ncbi:MAG: class I SAM-dependent DNA methyltransferase [Candidatus Promineifilaceae bacterium]
METTAYREIYYKQAAQYERLVAREDYQGNILPAVQEICAASRLGGLNGRTIIDTGAGTGRLTRLLAPYASYIYGFDLSPAMLAVAKQELSRSAPRNNWALAAAGHAHLPLPDKTADLIISGWSLCYLALDQPRPWRDPLHGVIGRFQQLLRQNGIIIILDTQGTGFTTPHPPDDLRDYFDFLGELGFQSRWIRTDYEFSSVQEAEELTRFFFGEELANQVVEAGSVILPECTGIWWLPGEETV